METIDVRRGISIRFLESFLYAGTSALLISISHLQPQFWFVSLFALVPFLWRAARFGLFESISSGSLLATSYYFVMAGSETFSAPGYFLVNLLIMNILFVLYGIVVNRIAKHIGPNAIFIAFFWLPLEYGLSHFAYLGNLFTFSETGSALLVRISSFFGLLMVSFLVALINSLIFIISEHFLKVSWSRASHPIRVKKEDNPYLVFKDIVTEKRLHHVLSPRAPPVSLNVCC